MPTLTRSKNSKVTAPIQLIKRAGSPVLERVSDLIADVEIKSRQNMKRRRLIRDTKVGAVVALATMFLARKMFKSGDGN